MNSNLEHDTYCHSNERPYGAEHVAALVLSVEPRRSILPPSQKKVTMRLLLVNRS